MKERTRYVRLYRAADQDRALKSVLVIAATRCSLRQYQLKTQHIIMLSVYTFALALQRVGVGVGVVRGRTI